MTTKHTPYTTTSKHALTVWSPTWWVPSLVWVPADLYGSQYRSIAQDIRSNEICWHILEPPSFHSLHTCNSASPSKSCGCITQNFRSIQVQNRCDVCVNTAYIPSVSRCTPIFQKHCFHDTFSGICIVPLTFTVKQYRNIHCYSWTAWQWRRMHHDPSICQKLYTVLTYSMEQSPSWEANQ